MGIGELSGTLHALPEGMKHEAASHLCKMWDKSTIQLLIIKQIKEGFL